MKKGKIGEFLYPSDNSYSKNLTNIFHKGEIILAGSFWKKPELVEVISESYKSTVSMICCEQKEHEFVNVKFKGEIFRVLNMFYNNLDEREEEIEMIDYMDELFMMSFEKPLFNPNTRRSDNSKGAESVLVNQNSK